MAQLFRRMALCGVGLIGGSLAMAARRAGLVGEIIGLGRTKENLAVAVERRIVDRATQDPAEAARDADLLVLAVPVRAIPETFAALAPHLAPGAIVTDVGSVKEYVVRELEAILAPDMSLVAAHPVAGKELTGAGAADPDLFRAQRVIITPSARSTPQSLARIEALWRAAGARVERMAPEVHDRILARSSHLPQVVASALAASLAEEWVEGRFAAAYGAGGLRDTTRLAGSSAELWRDICLANREAILQALELFRATLDGVVEKLKGGDGPGLAAFFEQGRRMREQITQPAAQSAKHPRPIVTIDGPASAGKSTVARVLARELGLSYVNTGAMYRAVAAAAMRAGIKADDGELNHKVAALIGSIEVGFEDGRVMLNGRDVSEEAARPEVSDLASRLSALPIVRERMREQQRAAGAGGGIVMEGRDIGTVIFSDADFKFFLDADLKVRARRRLLELAARGIKTSLEEVSTQLMERDRRDQNRKLAPLRPAPDAIMIDSTNLDVKEVVSAMRSHIEPRLSGPRA